MMLTLHIQPGAKATQVVGVHGEALKIKVAAPPVEGQANARLIAFLRKIFDVPSRQIALKQGSNGRHKLVEIQGSVHSPQILLDNGNPESGTRHNPG